MTGIKARVSGTVQGVGYRYYARRRAAALGLKGYVRNLPDGDVETVAEGNRPALEQFLADLREGPAMASVRDIDAEWYEKPEPRYGDFRILF